MDFAITGSRTRLRRPWLRPLYALTLLLPLLLCASPRAHAQAGGGTSLDAEFHDEYDQPASVTLRPNPAPAASPAAAAPTSAPAAPPSAATTSAAASAASDSERAADANANANASAPASDPEAQAARQARVLSSWHGATGGVHLVDASSGLPGSVRLSLGFDYFRGSNFLYAGDTDENVGGTLAMSLSPIDHLEVFGSLANHANSNNLSDPILMQIVGDLLLGVKGYTAVLPWLDLGGDLRLVFLNTVGDLGIVAKGTSLGLRGDATADLRRLPEALPLIFRGNLDYLLDNSGQLIRATEDARYNALLPSTRRARANEDRNLLTRAERFGLGIDRVDLLTFGVGVEVPLQVAEDSYIQPLMEWTLGLPVNRQGYNCLAVNTNARAGQADGCLAFQKLAAAPSILTLGARVLPPLAGFSAMIGFDIGLLGTSRFVRELAPTRPWALLVNLAYGADVRKPKPQLLVAPAASAPGLAVLTPAHAKSRVVGLVVDQAIGAPVVGAAVRYPGRELTAQLTADDGRFTSYELDAGEVSFEISHPDYESRSCAVTITEHDVAAPSPGGPQASAPAATASGLQPVAADGSPLSAAPITPALAAPQARNEIPLRCELVARPRAGRLHGSVVSQSGSPVGSAVVDISGPAQRSAQSDARGELVVEGLASGTYSARVDAPGFLIKVQTFVVVAGSDSQLRLTLSEKPKDSLVTVTAREVKIRHQINFKPASAEIESSSDELLGEIADVLSRNLQVKRVQVQGHTDNRGDPAQNLQLSQQRAESVVQWLVRSGLAPERLEAKGYGDSHPIVPNLTPGNRARNRRVQFIITDQ